MIGWFSFDGPFFSVEDIPENGGVYTVLSQPKENQYMMLGVEHSDNMRLSIQSHEKAKCWEENCDGKLCYMIYGSAKMDEDERIKIVKEIRMQYEMPCSPSATPEHGYWTP